MECQLSVSNTANFPVFLYHAAFETSSYSSRILIVRPVFPFSVVHTVNNPYAINGKMTVPHLLKKVHSNKNILIDIFISMRKPKCERYQYCKARKNVCLWLADRPC